MTNVEARLEGGYKVCITGEFGVGKTALMTRFVDGTFDEKSKSTIGVDFRVVDVPLEGSLVKLKLTDTAGQERFKTITASFYRGAHGVAIVFDPTDPETFQNCAHWVDEVDRYANEDTTKILIANKMDLKSEWKVTIEQAEEFAIKNGIKIVCATSAKTGDGVDSAFYKLGKEIHQRMNKAKNSKADSFKVEHQNVETDKKQKKCFI